MPCASTLFQGFVAGNTSRILHLALRLPPSIVPRSGATEVHVPVCQRDWLLAIWSVFSLQSFLKEKLPVIFHDDGSLTRIAANRLGSLFPGAVFRGREENDAVAESKLAAFPSCRAYRVASPAAFGRKFFDPMLIAKSKNVLCLDSDILFFAEPYELLELAGEPDVDMVHHCERQEPYINCTELKERFPGMTCNLNGGLTMRKTHWLTLGFLEEATYWLAENHKRLGLLRPGSDQLLLSVVASQGKTVGLPEAYSNDAISFRQRRSSVVTMHFHSWARYLMALEGIPEFLTRQDL